MGTLFPKTIPFEYDTPGSYSGAGGEWVPGATITSTFQGSVQPMSGKEIESLPANRRDMGMSKIYSSIPLPISTEGGDTKGAFVIWLSKKWEVVYEMENQNSLIPHYKYAAQYRGVVE
jgi:hypothetical protein